MMEKLLANNPLLPVATIDSIDDACWLAKVLLKHNINIIEVTLRTDCAIEAVKVLKQEFRSLTVGVGTLINVDDLSKVCKAGADFAVSPGFLPFMVTQAQMYSLPFMPGISTVSEAMAAESLGVKTVKVYPIASLGGEDYLKALHAVLPSLTFCPTGGINTSNYQRYSALPFVTTLGMGQLADRKIIAKKDEAGIAAIIRHCR